MNANKLYLTKKVSTFVDTFFVKYNFMIHKIFQVML